MFYYGTQVVLQSVAFDTEDTEDITFTLTPVTKEVLDVPARAGKCISVLMYKSII